MKRKRYENYDSVSSLKSFTDLRKWQSERWSKKKDLTIQIPQCQHKQLNRIQENKVNTSITWVGHSTFLIQVNGLNILTDPVWAKRMGLQKRLTEPGIRLGDLPRIDAVLISHGHYDHLDFATIKQLNDDIHFFVPAGLNKAFRRRGYKNVVEANWWETIEFHNLSFSFVPAQHWTKRTLFDTNTSHWGGWIIQDNEKEDYTIYFVGDTGYFRGFKEVGEKFNIHTVLMPIGAYEPEWFMATSHINPEDAVKAFIDMNASVMIPMHYGAYRLADDTGPEALERLQCEWNKLQLPEDRLKVLTLGETLWGT